MINLLDIKNEGCIFSKGTVFFEKKKYSGEALKVLLDRIHNKMELDAFLSRISGHFSFVLFFGGSTYIVMDSIRSYPIFWKLKEQEFKVSENAYDLVEESDTISQTKLREFEICGYTLGTSTLIENIHSVNAGTYLVYSTGVVTEEKYLNINDCLNDNLEELIDELILSYNHAAEKLISYLDGRTAVIPLSSGLDSRFILQLLIENGYKNIKTFTYGKALTDEVLLSQQVAKRAGVEWVYVPYNGDNLQSIYYNKEKFEKLVKVASNLQSLPHVQDWYAVDYLLEHGIISGGDVVLPGHSVTNMSELTPTELTQMKFLLSKDIARIYSNANFIFGKKNPKNVMLMDKTIEELYLDDSYEYDSNQAYAQLKEIGYQERQVKYIGNSMRTYEVFGLDWYMIFWDNEIVLSWAKVPFKYAQLRHTYYKMIEKMFPGLIESVPRKGHDNELQIEEIKTKEKLIKIIKNTVLYKEYSMIMGRYRNNMNLSQYISTSDYFKFYLSGNKRFLGMHIRKTLDGIQAEYEKHKNKRDKSVLNERE